MTRQTQRKPRPTRPLRETDTLPEDIVHTAPDPSTHRPRLAGNPRPKRPTKTSPDVIRSETEPLPGGGRASQIELHLVPNRHDERFQALVLRVSDWDLILRASARGGYTVQERTGVGPDHAVW